MRTNVFVYIYVYYLGSHGYIIEWIYHRQGFDVILWLGMQYTLDIEPQTYNLSLVFVKLIVVKGVQKTLSLNFVKFNLFLCIIKIVGDTKELNNLVNILYFEFKTFSISQSILKVQKTDHILEISKQGPFDATQLLGGKVMSTRFQLQYLISAYSRAPDLSKFSNLDPELHFKLF